MNKKILIVAAVMMIACVAGVFAFGIGVQGGYNMGIPGNVAITFKLDSLPLIFAGNFYFGDGFAIGLTGDYWVLNNNLAGPLNYFVGVGFGATIGGFNDDLLLAASARLPVGLNMFLANNVIEPYIQVVPMLRLGITPSFNVNLDLDANFGLRFWF